MLQSRNNYIFCSSSTFSDFAPGSSSISSPLVPLTVGSLKIHMSGLSGFKFVQQRKWRLSNPKWSKLVTIFLLKEKKSCFLYFYDCFQKMWFRHFKNCRVYTKFLFFRSNMGETERKNTSFSQNFYFLLQYLKPEPESEPWQIIFYPGSRADEKWKPIWLHKAYS